MKEALGRLVQSAQEKMSALSDKLQKRLEELKSYAAGEISACRLDCLESLGELNSKLGNREAARDFYLKALEVAMGLPRDEDMLDRLIRLNERVGASLEALDEHEQSREYYIAHYLLWLDKVGEDSVCEEHISVYGSLGDLKLDSGELDIALEYYKKRLDARRLLSDDGKISAEIAGDMTVIGLVYRRLGDFKEAIAWQKDSYKAYLELSEAGEFDWALYDCLGHLVDTYERAGKRLTAHYYRYKLRSMEKSKPSCENEDAQDKDN